MSLLAKMIEPKQQISEERKTISNDFLKKMIVPLFFEQLFTMVVGLVDTMMVSHAGEAAVSGVSLDTMIYTIFMYIFSALAVGGSVVISQYIGKKDNENAILSASQTMVFTILVSLVLMVPMILFGNNLLHLLYPSVEAGVMEACKIYLRIVVFSFPANAIYNVGASLFRSMGKTNITMRISLIMNIINVVGNAIGIFVLHAGAAGVAWPTTISWYVAAILMTYYACNRENPVYLAGNQMKKLDRAMIGRIVNIAVPNSIENGLFQLSKVVLGSLVATFGTSQIAANGIGQTIWSLAAVMMVCLSPACITVTGRCMGAGDTEAAEYYTKKMLRLSVILSSAWNVFILALLPLILKLYDITPETRYYIIVIVIIHNIFCGLVSPFSGPLGASLRAAGDVKFAMYAAIFSTVICRVALSFLFGKFLGLGVIGIAIAMVLDWSIRAGIQWARFKSGAWKTKNVIA